LLWVLDLDEDIESDLHHIHGVWTDLDQDEFGGFSAERLFSLIERLPAYSGVVAARIHSILEEEKTRNPSRAAQEQPGSDMGDGTTAGLRNNPQLAGIVEVVQV